MISNFKFKIPNDFKSKIRVQGLSPQYMSTLTDLLIAFISYAVIHGLQPEVN